MPLRGAFAFTLRWFNASTPADIDFDKVRTMSLRHSINQAAKAVVLTDARDLPGLVALQDLLQSITREAQTRQASEAAASSAEAAELVEQIVLRQVADVEQAFLRLTEAISRLDETTPEDGANAPSLSNPNSGRTSVDRDLIAAWVSGCEATIPELEHLAVACEDIAHAGNALADVKRRIHTFKGECGVLSLDCAQRLCHDTETHIEDALAQGHFPVDAVLALADWLRTLMAELANDPVAAEPDDAHARAALRAGFGCDRATAPTPTPPPAIPAPIDDGCAIELNFDAADDNLADFVTEAREHLANAENSVLQLEKNSNDPEHVNVIFRAFHTIKGVAGFMNLVPVVRCAHAAECLLDRVRSGTRNLDNTVLDLVLVASDILGQLIASINGAPLPSKRSVESLIVRLELASDGNDAPAQPPSPNPSTATGTAAPAAAPLEPPAISAMTASDPNARVAAMRKGDQTVKVSTLRLDSLVNEVGELVIAQLMVMQDPTITAVVDQRLQRNLAHLGKIVRDLQETSMSLRMVTLRATFQKMARLVRDVAHKAGKRVQLVVDGEDVELDRNVVEEIGDPLVHMIRNACDHGIESAADRRAAGKDETGTLKLRAFHSGGSIVIEVADDGRGLNRGRILKKCVERGLLDPARNPADIPDSEVWNYVFLPGFSTAEKVTDISGRGVGMDVVRRNIEALRGSVEIYSTPGEGSVFSMRLPLTMAIIDGMIVRIGTQRYVVPTLSIERSFRPLESDLTMVFGKGELVRVGEQHLAVHRLKHVFDIDEGVDALSEGLLLVLESGKRRACVFVDEILGQQQVVIKTLGARESLRGVSGGAILGDGRVALIVDVGGLLEEAASRGHDRLQRTDSRHSLKEHMS